VVRCSGGQRKRLGLSADLGQDAVELLAGEGPFEGAGDVAVVLAEVRQASGEFGQGGEVVGC
jgi:hypothetical protein